MQCSIMTTAEGCMFDTATGVQTGVIIHYEYSKDANGATILYKTRFTNAAGVPIALTGTQSVSAGVCQPISTDIEFLQLCDDADNNSSTDPVPFIRKITRTSNSLTGAKITEVIEDFELDLTTAYTVAGTVVSCASGGTDTEQQTLCDATGKSFLRRYNIVNGVQVTVADTELDGTTAYTPVAPVGACPQCAPKTAQGVVSVW